MLVNIKKSLLCISAISCMSLYASTIKVDSDITIGSTPSVPTETGYNYWLDGKTYVFNRSSNNNDTYWIAYNKVTIDNGYTLKLITTGYDDCYYYVLYCLNTFTNNGNVTIDNYGALLIDYDNTTEDNPIGTSINNGTIDINNGLITLRRSAILNNTGTITLKGRSFIDIDDSSTLTNAGTITLKDSSFIFICDMNSTLTNKGTIDISNITDLSYWYNDGTFKLEGGSTFILPKSISSKVSTSYWSKPITLNGTTSNKVNIVIPKDCKYIKYIDNDNKGVLFCTIQEATGLTFNGLTFDGNKDNVNFSWQTSLDNECEYVDEC